MSRCRAVAASSEPRIRLDDLVDVDDGDEQTLDEVQSLLAPGQPVRGAAPDDVGAEVDVDLEQVLQAEVRGWPSTSATLLMLNDSSIGVSR